MRGFLRGTVSGTLDGVGSGVRYMVPKWGRIQGSGGVRVLSGNSLGALNGVSLGGSANWRLGRKELNGAAVI